METNNHVRVESGEISLLLKSRHKRIQLDEGLVEKLYKFIQSKDGRVTTDDMSKVISNKDTIRRVLTRLTVRRRIRRVKTFGQHGIIYTYTTKV